MNNHSNVLANYSAFETIQHATSKILTHVKLTAT